MCNGIKNFSNFANENVNDIDPFNEEIWKEEDIKRQ